MSQPTQLNVKRNYITYANFEKKTHIDTRLLTLSDSDNSICDSVNCVRCSRNHEILQKAITRLSYFCLTDCSTQNDVECLSKDIEKSLFHLKNKTKRACAKNVQNSTQQKSSPVVFKMSGLMEKEFWPFISFPALNILNNHFDSINSEFNKLYTEMLHDKSVWKINITNNGRWEIAHLINQGCITKVARMCPTTFQVLKNIPYFLENNIFGDASFSVVYSGTHLATHCGSTNLRIRCHLGLKIPDANCYLKVGQLTFHWEEKKVLCFNDAYPHSVHYEGSETNSMRAVLMFDIWHPDITEAQKKIINFAFTN
ncbi:Aspartate beta-hydroxylase domain-containing protein 2 [Bulinus truncatus]|nr:Aspartate beta-hydroxylase domain-containing protein 2 [Bulinus truncatus]